MIDLMENIGIGWLFNTAIGLAVGIIWFVIISFYLTLPGILNQRLLITSLRPYAFYGGIWKLIKDLSSKYIAIFAVGLIACYIAWKVLHFLLPISFPILILPPFPQMERTGLFRLCDRIASAIFSFDGLKKRAQGVALAMRDFMKDGTVNTIKLLHLKGFSQDEYNAIQDAFGKSDKLLGVESSPAGKPTRQSRLQRNKKVRDPPLFGDSDSRMMEEKYQQCLEENIIPITNDLSSAERSSIDSKNSVARIRCGINNVTNKMQALTARL